MNSCCQVLFMLLECSSHLLHENPAAAAAKSLQSCPTLCDPIDSSPRGSPVPGILQARTLEWFAISFSNAWKWKVKVKLLSRVWLLATPWTAAHQAPPSIGFSREEYWSGCHFLLHWMVSKKKRRKSRFVNVVVSTVSHSLLLSKPVRYEAFVKHMSW